MKIAEKKRAEEAEEKTRLELEIQKEMEEQKIAEQKKLTEAAEEKKRLELAVQKRMEELKIAEQKKFAEEAGEKTKKAQIFGEQAAVQSKEFEEQRIREEVEKRLAAIEEQRAIEVNLLRLSSQDLPSAPATPLPPDHLNPPELTPGEEEAEKEKKEKLERRKKALVRWNRFMRTLECEGLI